MFILDPGSFASGPEIIFTGMKYQQPFVSDKKLWWFLSVVIKSS